MENQKPKSPFAKISTFATVSKLVTDKNGRQLVIKDFALSDSQFEEIDDLAITETEVMLMIQPSRRGTLYAGTDVDHRITADSQAFEQNAIAELVIEVSNAVRSRMLERMADSENDLAWDDAENLERYRDKAAESIALDDPIDTITDLIIIRNLEKSVFEAEVEKEETEEESSLLDGQEKVA